MNPEAENSEGMPLHNPVTSLNNFASATSATLSRRNSASTLMRRYRFTCTTRRRASTSLSVWTSCLTNTCPMITTDPVQGLSKKSFVRKPTVTWIMRLETRAPCPKKGDTELVAVGLTLSNLNRFFTILSLADSL